MVMNHAFKHIVVTITFSLLVIFSINLAVNNPYSHRLIRLFVDDHLKSETNLRFEYEAMTVSLIPLKAVFYGVHLSYKPLVEEEERSLLKSARVSASASWTDIFLGYMRLDRLQVQDVDVVWPSNINVTDLIPKSKSGNTAQAVGSKSKSKWSVSDIPIRVVHLSNARIYFEYSQSSKIPFPPDYTSFALSGASFHFSKESRENAEARVQVDKIEVKNVDKVILESSSIDSEFEINNKSIFSKKFYVKGRQLDTHGSLEYKFPSESNDDHQFIGISDGVLDLSLLGNYLDISKTSGPLNGQIKVGVTVPSNPFKKTKFTLKGKGTVKGGLIDGFQLFDSKFEYVVDKKKVEFKAIEIIKEGKKLGLAKGSIGFTSKVPAKFKVQANDMPLSDLLSIFNVDFDVFDATLNSNEIAISSQSSPFRMKVKSLLVMSDIWLPNNQYDHSRFPQPPLCSLNLDLNINSEGVFLDKNLWDCWSSEKNYNLFKNKPKGSNKADTKSSILSSGAIYFDENKGVNLNMSSNYFDLRTLQHFSLIKMEGRSKLDMLVAGPYKKVVIAGKVGSSSFALADVPLGALSAKFDVKNQTVYWRQVSLTSKKQRIASQSGFYRSNDDYWSIKASASHVNNKVMGRVLKQIFDVDSFSLGLKSSSVNLKGRFFQPTTYQGQLVVEGDSLKANDELIAERFSANIKASERKWDFAPVILDSDFVKVIGKMSIVKNKSHRNRGEIKLTKKQTDSVWFPFYFLGFTDQDSVKLSLSTEQQATDATKGGTVNSAKTKVPYIGTYLNKMSLTGRVHANIDLKGRFNSLQGTVNGHLDQLQLAKAYVAPILFRGHIHEHKLNLILDHSGRSLEGRLSADFADPRIPYSWYFKFSNFDIRGLLRPIFYRDPRNYAYLDASWEMEGYLTDLWKSYGHLDVHKVRVKHHYEINDKSREFVLKNSKPASIRFNGSKWFFAENKPLEFDHKNFNMKFEFSKKHRPPDYIDIIGHGQVDLELFANLFESVETAEGAANIDLRVHGPSEDINFESRFYNPKSLFNYDKSLKIGFIDYRPAFTNIELDLRYKKGVFLLNQFKARKGAGYIRGKGRYSLLDKENSSSKNLARFSFEDLKIIHAVPYLKSFDSTMTGEVVVAGNQKPYLVSGDIKVNKARSTRKFNIRDEVINSLRQEAIDSSVKEVEQKPLFNFDVKIAADDAITISNDTLKLFLSSQLRLTGSNQIPILAGNVSVNKGKFTYKRDFDIKRGEVTFDDPVKINPKLDVVATTNVNPYLITIVITGQASRPSVELNVEPATRDDGTVISQLDAIVLLSTGKLPPTNKQSLELGGGIGLSEVINYVGQVPFEKLAEKLGQRNIHIYPEFITDDKGLPIIQLNVPIKLTNDVDMVIKQTASKSKLAVEVPIHDNITISGSREKSLEDNSANEQTDEGSVDLKFRFSFK